MKVTGECLCGAVSFAAEVYPESARICHCTDCQINSASAFGTVVTLVEGTFSLTRGEMEHYVKTAESGNRRDMTFCATCGTRIYSAPDNGEGYTGVRIGLLKEREKLAPKSQIWTQSALDWVGRISDLPAKERQK